MSLPSTRKTSGDFEFLGDLATAGELSNPVETKKRLLDISADEYKHENDRLRGEIDALKTLVRGIFKPDRPYRDKLSSGGVFNTTGSGTFNSTWTISNISTALNWTQLTAMFDEFFIHSMTFHFSPYNGSGGSITGGSTDRKSVV